MPQTTPTPTTLPTPTAAPLGWWSRNWKWVVPTGCFGLFLLFVCFVAAIVFTVFAAMKSGTVYQKSLARAEASSEVKSALGTPIKAGFFVTGNESTSGPSGKSELSIPVSGPKGKATIYAVAAKSAGQWHYSILEVEIANRQGRINLLAGEEGHQGER